MQPEIFRLPFNIPLLGGGIKGYGFMMMVGFLSAIYLITRRTIKAKGDPDFVLNCGFIALITGVLGARLFYVVHYWQSQFAYRPNKVVAVLDVTAGGLEFYGGFLGAMVFVIGYMLWKRVSARMYCDLIIPGLFWGLAITRVGCFLNGCCWGGICMTETGEKALPWAVQFPFGSPAHHRHWEEMRVTVPAELLMENKRYSTFSPLHRDFVKVTPEELNGPKARAEAAVEALERARQTGEDAGKVAKLKKEAELAEKAKAANELQYGPLTDLCKEYGLTPSQIRELASLPGSRSLPVHPAQLYAAIGAMILSICLSLLLRVRKRHGLIFGVALLLYPIQRFVEELVRTDNPQDTFGLTISQGVSVGMLAVAVVYLIVLYRLPLRSPLAVPFVPPVEDASGKKK
jgi:phosphatidylglycerol---prolipoprotein diacylglyceryl transferase